MKLSYLIFFFTAALFTISTAAGQANASINVLTQNSGMVEQGGTVFLQVDVGNTGPTSSIGVYKIKTQVSVPTAIVSIAATGHQLPAGWTITSQTSGVINLSNGTDIIPVNAVRTIMINIQGNTIGGPSTVSGVLSFSNGVAPGTGFGSLAGDNTADNSSQSSVLVTTPSPVTLTGFDAALVNCRPVLNWVTESEINSDRFEIERSISNSTDWKTAGFVTAHGFSSLRHKYSFADNSLNTASKKIFYRLKMIDRDGRYEYSDILPVSINCNKSTVSVFPNPVQNGKLYISLAGTKGNVEVALLSLSGQVILKSILNNGTSVMNVSKLAAGIYILNVNEAGGVSEKVKVNIQN